MSDRYFAFISYANVRREWVARFHRDLERCLEHYAQKVGPSISQKVFFDKVDLRSGVTWIDQFQDAVDRSERLILVVSPEALASDWVRVEWQSFFTQRPRDVFPVCIAEAELPAFLDPIHRIDFSGLEGDAYKHRLRQFFGDLLRRSRRDLPPMPPELTPPIIDPPESNYTNAATRDLSRQLDGLYEERAKLLAMRGDLTNIDRTIVSLKNELRRGPSLEPGDFLLDGRFKLLDTLGRGGFGMVWKAYDCELRILVAVKVLHSQYSRDQSRRNRFLRGARQMASLRHPGIVSVVEKGHEDDGYHFFVMEYLPGGDFNQAVLEGRLSREKRIRVVLDIGEALSYAHNRGVIHRDVKPANILLDLDGRAKLTDFDLVRAADTPGGTRTAEVMGTIVYAAPEAVLDGRRAAEPADVFGLGMTTVFALHGEDLPGEAHYDVTPFIEGLEVTPKGREVLRRALEQDANLRWPAVADFCSALASSEHGLSAESDAEEDSKSRDPSPWLWPRVVISARWLSILVAVIVISLSIEIWPSPELEIGPPWTPPPAPIIPQDLPEHCRAAQAKTDIELVHIPAGFYPVGEGDRFRRVRLDSFWLGKYPVTNEQYRRFVESAYFEDSKLQEPSKWNEERFNASNQPVVGVSWNEAMAFASWAGFVLPSEEQWEAAARGLEGRDYPWGAEFPTPELADFGKEFSGQDPGDCPDPVGSHPKGAGPFGAEDQVGGVWEWCIDEVEGQFRSLRGGSWSNSGGGLSSRKEILMQPENRPGNFGFRVSCSHRNYRTVD